MSVRDGSPTGLRSGALSVRGTVGQLGVAAWIAQQQQQPVLGGWWGSNGARWVGRDVVLVQALRVVEQVLQRVAAHVEAYADAVERGQRALDALDEQLTAVQDRQRHEEALWHDAPAEQRGPRPDHGHEAAVLLARRRAVEEDAEQAGDVLARQVLAALDGLPAVETVRSVLSRAYLYGYALPSGLGSVAGAPELARGRSLVPEGLRGPLKAFDEHLGPVRFVVDADVVLNGSGNGGVRGWADRGTAAADALATGGMYVGAATGSAAVGTAVGVASAVTGAYTLGTWAWDNRPGRGPRRPRRPVPPQPLGPRVPVPLLPPPPGQGLGPSASTPGMHPVARPGGAPSGPPSGVRPGGHQPTGRP